MSLDYPNVMSTFKLMYNDGESDNSLREIEHFINTKNENIAKLEGGMYNTIYIYTY